MAPFFVKPLKGLLQEAQQRNLQTKKRIQEKMWVFHYHLSDQGSILIPSHLRQGGGIKVDTCHMHTFFVRDVGLSDQILLRES